MYARVAKWEGGEADALRQAAERINGDAHSGPPPGLPARGLLMLIDPDAGTSMSVVLFDTEEDMRVGSAVLDGMDPSENTGTRVSVETYEVGVDVRS